VDVRHRPQRLHRLTWRAAIDHVPRKQIDREPVEIPLDAPADGHDVDLVRRALLALPVERREVLVLSRYEFKTYEEIARALGCSVGAVKVRAHRAIKQLREIYLDLAEEASA
jgi:RNA polymerase sigma-70 factor (ECF subfamily)